MSTHLQKITAKAKQLRKTHPKMKWQSLVSLASKKVKPAAKKSIGAAPKKKTASKKAVVRKTVVKRTTVNKTTASIGSVSSHLSIVKKMLLKELGELEVRKFQARLKRDKNKIQKLITEKRAKIRRLG